MRYAGTGAGPSLLEVVAIVIAAAYGAVGGLVAARRGSAAVGWTLLAISAVTGTTEGADMLAVAHAPGWGPAAWVQQWIFYLVYPLAFSILLLVFPSGRLPSTRWRWIAGSLVVAEVPRILIAALAAGPISGHMSGMLILTANPVAVLPETFIESATGQLAVGLSWALPVLGLGLAGAGIVERWRSSRGVARHQLKWLGLVAVLAVLAFGLHFLTDLFFGSVAFDVGGIALAILLSMGIPAAIAAAIGRYHLYDVDTLLNPAIVYGLLTGALLAIYAVVVSGLDALLRQQLSVLASLAATGLVAVMFAPLRSGIQEGVNRLLFGGQPDPYDALAKVTLELAHGDGALPLLDEIAAAIARSLAVPYCAIVAHRPGGPVVSSGTFGQAPKRTLSAPLHYRGENVGAMHLAPGEGWPRRPIEARLLSDLGAQAAVAANFVLQATDLDESRSRVLATRDEERRRLRRDLHDGLGPALAAQTLKAGAARRTLESDPARAKQLLSEIEHDGQATMTEVRRLVHALRPPALDELGLAGALREVATSVATTPLRMVLDIPDDLPRLSGAVEEATLRIAQEAINNVRRHAKATECKLAVEVDGDLRLTVSDDGIGIESGRGGVGLTSIKERAHELGGRATVGLGLLKGTVVEVRLPLHPAMNR